MPRVVRPATTTSQRDASTSSAIAPARAVPTHPPVVRGGGPLPHRPPGEAGEEVPIHVAAREAVDAGHRHEVGVRPEGVERIELNAAEPLEKRPDAFASASVRRTREAEVADEVTPGLGRLERQRPHDEGDAPSETCSVLPGSAACFTVADVSVAPPSVADCT